MLQSLRDNLKGTVATIVVIIFVIPLAVSVGFDSFMGARISADTAAEVNGEKISEMELNRAILMQKQRLEAQLGQNAPADFFSEERLRDPVLKGLVQRMVLTQEAREEGMAIPDSVLNELIVSTEQFQEDGKFSAERYTQLLRTMGYTPAYYKRLVAQDLLLNQHTAGVTASGFVTEEALRRTAALSQQTRDFSYLTIPLAAVEQETEVSEEAIKQHYDEHQAQYMTEEQVSIEYLDISPAGLSASIDVSEEAVRQQYEQDVKAFKAQTQRQAAHILIEPEDDGGDKTLVAELQNKLAAGEDFSELAQQYSDDVGSKEQGGDLGWSAGDTFPEAFETALAGLEVGAVSAPVETDAGIHLIKLLAVKGAQPPTFEEDRTRIERLLRQAEVEQEFGDILDQLEDLAYNADNLGDVAAELGVELKTSGPFGRQGGTGIAANPQVPDAAFSDRVLLEGNTSDVLELGQSRVVVLRMTEHLPARVKALEEVRSEIAEYLKHQAARERVAALGEELEKLVGEGKSIEEVATEREYEWQASQDTRRTDPKVNRALLQHVFSLPKPVDGPIVSGLHLANGDYAVVSFSGVKDGEYTSMAAEQKNSLQSRLASQNGGNDFLAYEALLQEKADIEFR